MIKYLLIALVFLSCMDKTYCSQDTLPKSYDNYFTIGLTDGDIFNGINGIIKPDFLFKDFPGNDRFFARRLLGLSIDFTREMGNHSIGISYVKMSDPSYYHIDIDYGYRILKSKYFKVSIEGGIMLGDIYSATIATRIGVRSYLYLYKNIHWYNNFSVYYRLDGLPNIGIPRSTLFYTTGLSYKF